MRVDLIPSTGEVLPVLELAELPRAGDTLSLEEAGDAWRVLRVHWPLRAGGGCQRVELHLARVAHAL